jgi:hypothetical protein
MLRDGRDLFERPRFVWKLLPDTDLPAWLRQNRSRLQRMFHPASFADRVRSQFSQWIIPAATSRQPAPPVVICPYLYDNEPAEIRSKFDLDGAAGRRMDFFLWQDKERIGPEFAFEHCWNQFPDRDIIIIHSDMSPMPGEPPGTGMKPTLPRARSGTSGAPTGSLTRQRNRDSSSCSQQPGLYRRPPRPERQLALILLRRCTLQVRQYLRNELRLLDAGDDLQLATAARPSGENDARRVAAIPQPISSRLPGIQLRCGSCWFSGFQFDDASWSAVAA